MTGAPAETSAVPGSVVAVVDTGMSNLGSLANMLKKIGVRAVIARRPEEIEGADRVILPGVGAFARGMENLTMGGWLPVLERHALQLQKPFLGVCLGMQLLTQESEEGDATGLGWLPGTTVRFQHGQGNEGIKVPHMGWNMVERRRDHPLLSGATDDTRFYFVHAYHVRCDDAYVVGVTEYGYRFPSIVARGNIMGVQFHPEKSHQFGMRLLRSFATT